MRNFSSEIIAEIEKEVASTFYLLELDLTSNYYFTDRDHDIYYNGHNYLATGFEFSDLAYAANMSVDKVTIDIDNVGLGFSSLLLGEDVRNKRGILSFGCSYGSPPDKQLGVVDLFNGLISDWQVSETKASITLVNEFILWKKKALRIAQPSCPWDFVTDGSGECGYSGTETWCDHSYERCVALGNSDNFGGFRFLPSIMEKEIWWGRTQK